MPFTPFHIGLAVILKPVAKSYFSVFAFGIAQIAMDIQPLLGLLYGWPVLHGWTHTYLGALLIALCAFAASYLLYPALIKLYNAYWIWRGLARFAEPARAESAALLLGSLVGTLSHVVLDSMMHGDMQPLAPFSARNPWLGLIDHDQIYNLCSLAGLLGLFYWWLKKVRQGKDESRIC